MGDMAGSRSTPPLFDLLRPGAERQDEAKPTPQARPAPPPPPPPPQARTAPAVSKPIVRLDTAPKPAAAAPAPRPVVTPSPRAEAAPAPRPRVTESPAKSGTRQSINIGVIWVWLAVAGVFASWLLVWGVAYTAGRSEATQRLSRFEPAGSPPPVVTRQPSAPIKQPAAPDKTPSGPATGKEPVAAKPAPTAPALPAADTRQAGLNYLLCASLLDKAAAEAAAGFLTQNNIPAAAVPTKTTNKTNKT